MDLELKNKVVLITASGQGLGKGIAEGFLNEGAKTIITDINKERLLNTVKEFKTEFGDECCFGFPGDLTVDSIISNCIEESIKEFGKIDILVANMGSGRGPIDWNISDEDWKKMIEINFEGARKISNVLIPHFISNGEGNIVYISSIAGVEVIGAPIHYSVAKASLIAFSKNLSVKLAKFNIRVNTISPGNILFKNGTWDIKMKENYNSVQNMLKEKVPLNCFATPNDIANIVLFLSSERAKFITGSNIVADGGQTVNI